MIALTDAKKSATPTGRFPAGKVHDVIKKLAACIRIKTDDEGSARAAATGSIIDMIHLYELVCD